MSEDANSSVASVCDDATGAMDEESACAIGETEIQPLDGADTAYVYINAVVPGKMHVKYISLAW